MKKTIAVLAVLLFATAAKSFAQLPNETDTTATPAPGFHDYIQSPVETVNPANGSVSVRIPIRIAAGRGLTLPFAVAYDSNGAYYFAPSGGGPAYKSPKADIGSQGGWSYTYPLLSFSVATWTIPNASDGTITCYGSYNYVFQDADGDRHNLGLSVSPDVASPDGDNCNGGWGGDGEYATGGEGSILATTSIPGEFDPFPPVYATTADATSYYFKGGPRETGTITTVSPSVSDRNGNTVTITTTSNQVAYTDTIGRTVLTVSGASGAGGNPDTITAAGLSTPYKVYWATTSAQFPDNMINLGPGVDPNCPTSFSGSSTVVSQIVLPNSTNSFSFAYDPTYGMLTKITYPGGGYVRYLWGLNPQAEAGTFSFVVNGSPQSWDCRYDFPAITDRYVSYDGTTEALHQHFDYATQWPSGTAGQWTQKTTTVTTTDNVRGTSYKTIYAYTPLSTPYVPNCLGCSLTNQMPVESTVQSYDYSGNLLQTVTKTWQNIRLLQAENVTLANGLSSLEVHCYNNWEMNIETDEYDLGTAPPTGSCISAPSGTTAGPLLRKTITNYASFTSHLVDLPSSVIVRDGSGNRAAETDYSSYDTAGNLITKTANCFTITNGQPCPQGNSTTTYHYDGYGQMINTTDPNNNPQTQYSYADNYQNCGGSAPPQSPSDAYLTQITYPSTNGVNHTVTFCYDYASGLLLSKTDENQQTTRYGFNDPLDRLRSISYPDGGSTGYAYADQGSPPTVTTTKQVSATQQQTTVSNLNGFGAIYEADLTSDPVATDHQITTFDGLGHPFQVSGWYRSTADPTYGVTTATYDALNRTIGTLYADGSSRSAVWNGNTVTISDESGNKWQNTYDALGRLTRVMEPSGSSQKPSMETDYTYDALNNLTRVDQWGGLAGSGGERVRTFVYDSLSQLTSATNPETGTVTYGYDPNGNLTSKTDARGVTATLRYDALNRLVSKSYSSSDASKTPWSCYQYDTSSIAGAGGYLVGRMTNEWTLPSGTSCSTAPPASGFKTMRSLLSYDSMGRILKEQQCTPAGCYTSSACPGSQGYSYDLAGDLTCSTNGIPSTPGTSVALTFTSAYDGAGRLQALQSSWTPIPNGIANPACVFQAQTSGASSTSACTLTTPTPYAPFGSLAAAMYGNGVFTQHRNYDLRLRVAGESNTSGH